MNPSLLTKIIVSGLMASAFLGLAACDNAARRAVKAELGEKAQQQAQNQIDKNTTCTPEILKFVEDRAKHLNEIKNLISLSEQSKLSAEQISRLKILIEDLKKSTDNIVAQIEKTKSPNGQKITGCSRTNSTSQKLSTLYSISAFKQEDVRVAEVVKVLTSETNSILEAAKNNSNLLEHALVAENQVYKIKTDLADALSEANQDGRMYVMDERVFTGTEAANQLTQLKTQNIKSFCYLAATMGKLQTDTEMKLTSIRSVESTDRKSVSALLVFTGESAQMFNLKCIINSNVGETHKQIRLILGELVELQTSASDEPEEAL